MEKTAQARSIPLDVLRASAVFLVLMQHFDSRFWWQHQIGWTGVDLFFVLSGFLVGGLLFSEWLANGRVDATRFLLRRGFKIYPSFWAMLAVTVAIRMTMQSAVPAKSLAMELLFLQNYGPSLWVHTWSLAVEEHFYLLLALLFVLWNRTAMPHQSIPRYAAMSLATVFVIRVAVVLLIPARFKLTYWGTHARLDALLFGTLLAYGHHFHRDRVEAFVRRRSTLLVVAAGILLSPMLFVGARSLPMLSFGLTALYVGFGAVLLLAIHAWPMTAAPFRVIAWIGKHSYGIYLWHVPVRDLVLEPLKGRAGAPSWVSNFWFFVAVSVVTGVVLSRLIEFPALALRDRWMPARTKVPSPRAA